MTIRGGGAIPVSITTTRPVRGGSAIPVYGYSSAALATAGGNTAIGGSAIPIRVLTAADLKQNGGQWTLEGSPQALPVYTAESTQIVEGGYAIPVYPVNASAWPYVPTPSFDPLSLSPALWLDASDATTLYQDSALTTPATSDSDPVGGWKDKSGNNRHVTQATGGKRPTLKLAIQNGKPIVRGDGVDDELRTASNLTQATVIAVCKINSGTTSTVMGNDVLGNLYAFLTIGADMYTNDSATFISGPNPSANFHILTAVHSASATLRVDGGAIASGSLVARTGKEIILAQLAGFNLDGDIAEAFVFGTALSVANIELVETYLNAKWAVY